MTASAQPSRTLRLLEAAVVLLGAPFLLFPERLPPATLLALLALVVVWLLPFWLSRAPGLPATPFNITYLLWGVVVGVAILVTADPDQTLPKATGLILGLAVWRLLVLLPRSARDIRLATNFYLLLGLGIIVLGLFGLQELPKIPWLAAFSPSRFAVLPDALGLGIHPNQLAGIICLFLPLPVSILFGGQGSRLSRVLLAATTATVIAALILTQSRGGWAAAAGGLFVLLLLWALALPASATRRLLRGAVAAAVLLAVVALLWIGPQRIAGWWSEPPEETVVGTFSTLVYRQELWPWALTAVSDFSLTGTGLGAFREVAFRLYPVPLATDADIGHAHNIFLQTALDVGLPGLIVYLAILLVALAAAWRLARGSNVWRAAALGLAAGLIALHLFGLADAVSLGAKPAVLFWFALGLLTAMLLRQTVAQLSDLAERGYDSGRS